MTREKDHYRVLLLSQKLEFAFNICRSFYLI
jgi:hypothetical protein